MVNDMKITIGKYKGKSVEYLRINQPDYIKWILAQHDVIHIQYYLYHYHYTGMVIISMSFNTTYNLVRSLTSNMNDNGCIV